MQVIRECGLLEDLQRLPEGDLTWVKKNGDNLSGGQRQRISLARAVFKNAGIYLLDDPMSAIDPCLRVRIFDQVIGNKGLLRKKTRIIITKDQRFLHKLDYILVMKNQVKSILQCFRKTRVYSNMYFRPFLILEPMKNWSKDSPLQPKAFMGTNLMRTLW